jgi:5-methylthioadenosine/S-adenosylhomocysteine deaminase
VLSGLAGEAVTVVRHVRYHQYDTYFFFDDPAQGRLRYREDEFLDDKGEVERFRARLTLTGESRERAFGSVLLFRSRYLAPATHSLRFYREYFKPREERHVEKVRRRWLVAYRGIEFYVHLDELIDPATPGWFLEVKSRTWSRRDAEDKAAMITELLGQFGARPDNMIADGYVDFADPGLEKKLDRVGS